MKRKVGARLAASAGLALSVDKVMPTVREMCSREMLDESILKYSLALAYTGILSLMVAASFYMVLIDGLMGNTGGWLPAAGCVLTGLLLAAPTLSLGIFVIKNFWWLALAVLAVLAVIGAIVGGVSSGVSIRLRTTCIIDSKLKATCSSWPKLGQVDSTWFVLPTCLAGVPGELHGCSRSRVSGAGYPPSIHVD